MAQNKDASLAVIKEKTAALASYGVDDLKDADKVAALIQTAKEVNEQMKALKDEDGRVKAEFKRICKPYTDGGHNVTCYDFANKSKMTLTLSGGGIELDEKKLIEGIYEMYGEPVGDKGGKAWRAYCAISDPLEAPRQLNPEKLAMEVARAQRIVSGVEGGEIMVTEELVKNATSTKKPTLTAKVMGMNKEEKAALEMGQLTEPMKVD